MNTYIRLDLAKLSADALSRIRAPFRPGVYPDEIVIQTHAGWRSASPACRVAGMRWEPSIVMRPQNSNRTRAAIHAKINVPLALFGPGPQDALSVHTAGLAALELMRIELAAHGIPREELDRLSEDDVRLWEAVATYIISCSDGQEVLDLLENIDRAGAILNRRAKSDLLVDFTVKLPYQGFTVIASACSGLADNGVSDTGREYTAHALRIDVHLRNSFLLRDACLSSLHYWRDDNTVDPYESLFDETVRERLRFNGDWLTHQFPKLADDKYKYLTPDAKQLLSWYLSGNDPRQFKDIAQSARPEKTLSEFALFIRDWTRIDINIPWKYHATLRCEEMAQRLRYAESWQTSVSDFLRYINDKNWEHVKQALNERYEAVLQLGGKGPRERTYAAVI